MKRYILLSLVALAFTACSKYEEGPKLSLASKKARVAGRWTPVKLLQDGNDVTANVNRAYAAIRLGKDGDAALIGYNGNTMNEGKWEFESDKENLALTITGADGVSYKEVYKIVKLKKKEIWLQYTTGDHTYEDHWEQ